MPKIGTDVHLRLELTLLRIMFKHINEETLVLL